MGTVVCLHTCKRSPATNVKDPKPEEMGVGAKAMMESMAADER